MRQGHQQSSSVVCDLLTVLLRSPAPTYGCQRLCVQSLNFVSSVMQSWDCHIQANVSSILTISLADVSMKPQPRDRAHSQPVLLLTTLASFRSHLLPATIMTGGILQPSSRLPLTLVPFSRSNLLFSSTLFSASMLIMSRNHCNPSMELEFVMS